MANLKLDLINKLNNEKYYAEMEFIRLAQEPNMYYKKKIEDMSVILDDIATTNSQLELVEQYFKEKAPTKAPQNKPQGEQPVIPPVKTHQGQSHGE